MSIKNEFLKNKTRIVTLLELSLGFVAPLTEWVKYAPGIWKFRFYNIENDGALVSYSAGTGAAGHFSAGTSGSGIVPTLRYRTVINSVLANGVSFISVSSIASVVASEKTFYWDNDAQTLYIQFADSGTPYEQEGLTLGTLLGFCANTQGQYFNDVFYDGRLLSIPTLSKKRNPLFFGTTSLGNLSFTLDNSDGYFNDFRDNDIYGMRIQLKVGYEGLAYSSFITKYTGALDDYSLDDQTISIKAVDDQTIFNRKVGLNYLSVDNYPNLDDKNEGKSLPLAWGFNDRCEAICLNEMETASTYNFIFADTEFHDLYSIVQVYVDGVAVPHTNESLSGGTFDLANTVYEPGQDVTISFYGFVDSLGALIEHPLEVIEDVLLTYENRLANNDFYDSTNWNKAIANINYSVSYTTGFNQKTIETIINDMGQAAYGTFEVLGDGRYTFRRSKRQNFTYTNIRYYHLLRPARELSEGNKFYCSSVKIGFSPIGGKDYKFIFDRSLESSIVSKHRKTKEKEIKTFLQTKSQAEIWGNNAIMDFGGAFPNYKIKVPYELYDLNINDVAVCEIIENDIKNNIWNYVKCEIIGIDENLNDFTIDLTLRYIEDADGLADELCTVVDSDEEETCTVTDSSSLVFVAID